MVLAGGMGIRVRPHGFDDIGKSGFDDLVKGL